MLNDRVILAISELSCGADHWIAAQPIFLAGKAGGRLQTGRHINYNPKAASNPTTREYETKTSISNLFTTLLNPFDHDDTHFGSEHTWTKGPLTGLG